MSPNADANSSHLEIAAQRGSDTCHYLYCNRFEAGPDFLIHSHRHPYWQLEMVRKGRLETRVAGEKIVMGFADAILLPPDIEHSFVYLDAGTRILSLKFQLPDTASGRLVLKQSDSVGRGIADALDAFLLEHPEPRAWQRSVVEGLLWSWVVSMRSDGGNGTDANSGIVEKAKALVFQSEGKALTVEGLAKQMGLSVSYLRAEFRKKEDITLKHFLDRHRLTVALRHLAYSEMPLKEIAEKMEFYDLPGFTRFFKKFFGYGPKRFRIGIRKGTNVHPDRLEEWFQAFPPIQGGLEH